jgi:hypothetical protein
MELNIQTVLARKRTSIVDGGGGGGGGDGQMKGVCLLCMLYLA